jgi:hypothetical protein
MESFASQPIELDLNLLENGAGQIDLDQRQKPI